MSERINRREFSGGMALRSEAAPAWAQPAGTISVRQTADTKRFAEEPVLKWQPAEGSSAETIVLDPSRTYQEMLGFGGALTDASAHMINQLAPDAREKFLHELYHPSELGLEVTRGKALLSTAAPAASPPAPSSSSSALPQSPSPTHRA